MATPVLVSVRDFTTSRYGQIADNLDAPLTDVLARAEQAVQSRLQRNLVYQSYTERKRLTSNSFFIRNRPLTSITALQQRVSLFSVWQPLDPLLAVIEPGPGYFSHPYLVPSMEVEVTYMGGYQILPEDLREAIIMQAVLFSFQDLEVYGSGDAKAPGITYMWNDLDRILAPYRATGTVY